jgi:hypothetical protein
VPVNGSKYDTQLLQWLSMTSVTFWPFPAIWNSLFILFNDTWGRVLGRWDLRVNSCSGSVQLATIFYWLWNASLPSRTSSIEFISETSS